MQRRQPKYQTPAAAERKQKQKHIPFKSILLAFFLLASGVILIVLGSLLLTGHIAAKEWDRGYPLVFLGTLCFLPGFYFSRIAYYSYKGYRGYSFAQIPDYD